MAHAPASNWLCLPPAIRTLAYKYGRSNLTASGAPIWRSRLPRGSRHYATVEDAEVNRMRAEQTEASQHFDSNTKTESPLQQPTTSSTKTKRQKKTERLLEALRGIKSNLNLTKDLETSLNARISQAEVSDNPVSSLDEVLNSITRGPGGNVAATDPTGEDSTAEHAPDLDVIRTTMALPATDEYGSAKISRAVENGEFESALQSLCARARRQLQAEISHHHAGKKSGWLCKLRLNVRGTFEGVVLGRGISKGRARQAAWLHAIAIIHSRGALPTLIESPSAGADVKHQELKTLKYLKRTLVAPNREQYPGAPATLFDAATIHTGFVTLYERLGLSLQVNVNSASGPGPSKGTTVFRTSLQLLSPDSDEVLGEGEGEDSSKKKSKQAAWYSALCNLHENGTLKELLDHGTPEHTVGIDATTMKAEKDAKTEIYNFAASLGQVPQIEISKPVPRTFRQRKAKSSASLVHVSIRLAELGVEVTKVGQDFRLVELAAAVSFKRAIEDLIKGDPDAAARLQPSSGFRLLNTDTAKQFIEFLRENQQAWNVEVETESTNRRGTNLNIAQVKINGEPQGPRAMMTTKKQAEELAYLVAAVGLAKTRPDALDRFERRLKEGNGQLLKPPPSIDLRIDPGTLHLMKTALVDARAAGLPDGREILPAAKERKSDFVRRRRGLLSSVEMESRSSMLADKQRRFEEDPDLADLRRKKALLPMSEYRDQVSNMVSKHLYSIVVGATGSGKTTQVPQILLEDNIVRGRGAYCNIVCTQPRRIAATSVAVRVAAERAEPLQESVGYHVRFDVKLPQNGGSIAYCTTGILLEQLKHDPDGVLDTLSHIVIDEVHERDINIDFLMVVLKKALAKRQACGKLVPKVVLMSATLDTELFANYFKQADGSEPAPSLSVPGRTFPVKEKHLGQIMDELRSYGPELNAILAQDKVSDKYLERELALQAVSGNESAIDWKRQKQPWVESGAEDDDPAQAKEDAWVPTSLVASTIAHIARTGEEGAILAFLPGLDEIITTERQLLGSRIFGMDFSDGAKFRICLLHSSVPKNEQDAIFKPTPPGCRKIILSTNIAETSVTVTDVRHVVDAGKLRETRYDQVTRISGLQTVWESRSNAKQRAGRAGRVSEGHYYALYSRERSATLKNVGLPELLRSDLQETCLAVRQQFPEDDVGEFLSQAIEPPAPRAIQAATSELKAIEAFTEDENLTALGRVLAKLPIHPSLGKMVVIGLVFRCLSPILLLSAAANERPLFISGIGQEAKQRANRSKHQYADGGSSDHIATLAAFQDIADATRRYGVSRAHDQARQTSVHYGAFKNIDSTARQIVQALTDNGLLKAGIFAEQSKPGQFGPDAVNRNSGNAALVKCLWLSGVYPNLAVKRYQAGVSWRTRNEGNAMIHPSSINDDMKKRNKDMKLDTGTLMTFNTLSRSNDGVSLHMRDTTVLHPLFAALFGGRLEMVGPTKLEMDGWLPIYVQATDRAFAAKLVLETRKALDRALNAAFQALAEVKPGQGTFLEADPVIDVFTKRIAEVLDRASGAWVDQPWGGDVQRRAPAFGRASDGGYQPGIDGNWRDRFFGMPS